MSKKYLYLSVFFILFLSFSGHSQELLSLDDCRKLAIENNKNLKIATEQERVAYYQKKEAFSKYLPEFSAMGAYLKLQHTINLLPDVITIPSIGSLPSMTIPTNGIGEVDIRNIYIGSLSLTQPIFMGGRIVAYNDVMKNAELLAKTQKNAQLRDVIAETDAAYWQVVSLASKLKLAQSYVDLLKKMDSDISIMEQEGVATKADVLSVRVKLNEGEVALVKVENGLSLSRMFLNQLCGLDISRQNTLVDEQSESLNINEDIAIIPNVDEALSNRPEVKSLEYATKIYKGKERIARAEFLPQIGFRAGYMWTNPNSRHGFEKKFNGGWNLGLVVTIPFSFGNTSKLNAAKAQTIISGLQLADSKEKITLEVNQNAYKLTEAQRKFTMSEKNLEKADENLRYANVGFEEGVIPTSDVLAAHTAWLSAHSEKIDAQIDVKLSAIYLKKSLGRDF
ncbi:MULTISPECIES: TolC family protein [unclassified Dysgonomonas]|uniref:TolC family protein n=1 Tax=unclassified Dysgonomonas TaxID=2630389 RepID=UPI002474DB31|nr:MULTISPECIES: TolC family protein [unclassified Dysgonomonas]